MQNYELMLILSPVLSESEREDTLKNLQKVLKNFKAKVLKEDIWGEKKLAYQINKQDKGFYVLFDLELDGKNIFDITKQVNLDKTIFRHMFVKKEV